MTSPLQPYLKHFGERSYLRVQPLGGGTYRWLVSISGKPAECQSPLDEHHSEIAKSLTIQLPSSLFTYATKDLRELPKVIREAQKKLR